MGRKIHKVSLKAAGNSGVKIGYENFDESGPLGTTSKDYKNVPHITFSHAMQKLKVHALLICEFLDGTKHKKLPVLAEDDVVGKNFRICGVTISGDGDKEGIVMTVYHTLSTGFGYVFNTPNVRVENEGDSAYKFMADLLSDIEEVKLEAGEYLGGKYGAIQGKLFPKEGGDGKNGEEE